MTSMNATLYGQVTKPVIAFVGTWDPILPSHAALIERIKEYAKRNNMASMLVLLAPAPGLFLLKEKNEDAQWSFYNDIPSNIDYLLSKGVDSLLHIEFKKEYLSFGAKELFDTLCAHVSLAEFWFGARQNFGRGIAGSQTVTIALARERGIRLRRLAEHNHEDILINIRRYLGCGKVAEAIAYTNYPPIRACTSGILHLPWQAGQYHALALENLNEIALSKNGDGKPVEVTLYANGSGNLNVLEWPNVTQAKYLAFIAGPQDLP